MKSVFIIDDSPDIRISIRKFIQKFNYRLAGEADSVHTAIEWLQSNDSDIITLDMGLPDGTGFDVIDWVRENSKKTEIVVLTNYMDPLMKQKLNTLGISHSFDKSVEIISFFNTLEFLNQ